MKLPPGFWSKKEKKKCFLCDGPLGKNSGEIVYYHQEGEDNVEICAICIDKIEENDHEQTI
jgi:hypothetical protein